MSSLIDARMSEGRPPRLRASAAAGAERATGIWRELGGAVRQTANIRSGLRLGCDVLLFRALRLWPRLGAKAGSRQIEVAGARLAYRLNRGDIQGIREVWIDRIYRMPAPHRFGVIVDLGTNIGLTSVWLQREYGADLLIGVEPDPANAELARRNLRANGVPGKVLQAAIGPSDGEARFSAPEGASNLGRLSSSGNVVRQISMNTVLAELAPGQRIDLLKLDVEGAEQELLLAGDISWLERVEAIIAEFHPDRVDVPQLVASLEGHGFRYFPAGTLWPGSMDIFRKPRSLDT